MSLNINSIMPLNIVILAAGQGKRMQSYLPKPLHQLAGKPMLDHVLDTARTLNPTKLIVIYGHEGQQLLAAYPSTNPQNQDITFVEQKTFLGTGDAMKYAMPALDSHAKVLVLYADTPLIDADDLKKMINECSEDTLSWLSVCLDNPTGYGRIIRNQSGQMLEIIEEKDASPEQRNIREINSGIFVAPEPFLKQALPQLHTNNTQGEFYLTDIALLATRNHLEIQVTQGDPLTVRGVNDRIQLAQLERLYQTKATQKLMLAGATLIDPARVEIRGNVSAGKDCIIDINVIFEGTVTLGDQVTIGAGSIIKNATIESGTEILPYSVIDGAIIGKNVHIGPFARIRPNSIISDSAKVGNFVETKNVQLGIGAKANHLTYVGDATIGAHVNLGAGTITCNYDGNNKFQTVIKDHAFIGSNTALVAPVSIGINATVGAGSTISQDIPDQTLAFTRAPLIQKTGWQRPAKIIKS